MSALVLKGRDGQVGLLTLNRSQRHNSLVPELLADLLAGLEDFRNEAQIQAVVLKANGGSFSTGGDLKGFYDHLDAIEAYASEVVGLLNQAILTMIDLPIPVVTAVHGIVTGGSLGLVLASDIVLVTPEASFTPYYSVVGFSPDGGWTAWLPQIIGAKRTAQILMENATISAEEAVGWGLANRVLPREEIWTQALSLAQDITAKQPGSICQTKRLLRPANLAERLEAERRHFIKQIKMQETQKSMIAFLKKLGL